MLASYTLFIYLLIRTSEFALPLEGGVWCSYWLLTSKSHIRQWMEDGPSICVHLALGQAWCLTVRGDILNRLLNTQLEGLLFYEDLFHPGRLQNGPAGILSRVVILQICEFYHQAALPFPNCAGHVVSYLTAIFVPLEQRLRRDVLVGMASTALQEQWLMKGKLCLWVLNV